MDAQPRLLDLSRLVARAARRPTGIDRAERAWLCRLAGEARSWGLVRTPLGFLLIGPAGLSALARAAASGDWGGAGPLSRLLHRRDPGRAAAETLARRVAVARCRHGGLARLIRSRFPTGVTYYSLGHSNLGPGTLEAIRAAPATRIVAMLHDTIPLDLPETQAAGAAEAFAGKLARLARHADLLLMPSATAAGAALPHLAAAGRTPPIRIAPLGVECAAPRPDLLPAGLPPVDPYFVALGTIEPRKNIDLLLDVWAALGPSPPTLLLCGARGWAGPQLIARLEARPPGVVEVAGLSDGGVAALLDGARALLMPSRAEGYGLPPLEAAARGVPVVCGDLAIWRETLGSRPVYADPDDRYRWAEAIRLLSAGPVPRRDPPLAPPSWEDHFKIALGAA